MTIDLLTIAIAIAAIGLLMMIVRSFVRLAFWLLALGVLLVVLSYFYNWLVSSGLWNVFHGWFDELVKLFKDIINSIKV